MKPYKLLIVEDDEAACFGYSRYLTNLGYACKCIATLQAAKEIVTAEDFDGILLDLSLPDGNTIDWIETACARNTKSTAIIIITGSGDISIAVKAMKFGADNFLTKPVTWKNSRFRSVKTWRWRRCASAIPSTSA